MNLPMRLFQHPNGVWYAEFERNFRRSLGTRDKAEAQKIYRRFRKEYLINKVAFLEGRKERNKTLGEFAEEYQNWCSTTKAKHTLDNISTCFKKLAANVGEKTPIQQIDRLAVDLFLGVLARKIKPASVNTYTKILKSSFTKAVEWGYLKTNPFQKVELLKIERPLPRYLSRENLARIINAETDSRFRCLWLFLVLTGCRRGEALDLTWKQVDLENRLITVKQAKTGHAKAVWITDELMGVLQELGPGVGRLFPWTRKVATTRFIKLAASVGVKARLHDLRHTFAAYLVMAGVGLGIVKDLLGHASLQSTMIYSHLSQEHKTQALSKLKIAANLRQPPE